MDDLDLASDLVIRCIRFVWFCLYSMKHPPHTEFDASFFVPQAEHTQVIVTDFMLSPVVEAPP
jgi:hypothetical protein